MFLKVVSLVGIPVYSWPDKKKWGDDAEWGGGHFWGEVVMFQWNQYTYLF